MNLDFVNKGNLEELEERYWIMTEGVDDDSGAVSFCREAALNAATRAAFMNWHGSLQISKNKLILKRYLEHGITLVPTRGKVPLCKYADGKDSRLVRNFSQLLDSWNVYGITEYAFVPAKAGLVVFDLDRGEGHANKADGLENFGAFIDGSSLRAEYKSCFYFCYVNTPSGGMHIYYKGDYWDSAIDKRVDRPRLKGLNIEVKYNSLVTAGGSINVDGKSYEMFGDLSKAPQASLDFIELLSRPACNDYEWRVTKKKFSGAKKSKYSAWNETPEGVIDKALERYALMGNHDFIMKAAVLFRESGFDEETAKSFICSTPYHQNRANKADTFTCIASVFSGRA